MSSTELFFSEEQTQGLRFSLRVRERLCSQQTAYQKLELEEVIWGEIDEAVIEAARRYLPSVCSGVFEDGRVRLRVAPGEELVTSLADEAESLPKRADTSA